MNCKQGDLAIFIRLDVTAPRNVPRNAGKIVRCVKLLGACRLLDINEVPQHYPHAWQIDPPLVGWGGNNVSFCPDEWLRPIGNPGDDEVDETLRILELTTELE